MKTLREAAQSALECLENLQGGCTDSGDGTVEAITVWCPEVIDALRAALAQPAASDTPEDQHPLYVLGWKAGYKHGAWQAQPAARGEPARTLGDILDSLPFSGVDLPRLRANALPERAPLTDEQKDAMWRVAYHENSTRFGSFDWYAQGVEDAERVHGIVDKE